MRNRKSNRLKGYDYSRNNLYFVTNCVKDNVCCLGRVVSVGTGTGRDLSVHQPAELNYPELNHPELNPTKLHHPELNHSELHHSKSNPTKLHHPELHHPKYNHPEMNHDEIEYAMELNRYGIIVDEKINWLMQQYKYVYIHNYVVMPNHIHLILEIDGSKVADQAVKIKSLSSLMGAFKTTSSKEIHEEGFEAFAWHRSFHDHIIRDEKSYIRISNYIDHNPQKWFEDKFYSL